jgi:hypothetical protein
MITEFRKMAERWTSTVVARHAVDKFSGDLLSPRYMANLDSAGKGPARRIRCGRVVGYAVDDLVAWLEDRCQEEIGKRAN